jgi:predicted Zn-dependent peptidase
VRDAAASRAPRAAGGSRAAGWDLARGTGARRAPRSSVGPDVHRQGTGGCGGSPARCGRPRRRSRAASASPRAAVSSRRRAATSTSSSASCHRRIVLRNRGPPCRTRACEFAARGRRRRPGRARGTASAGDRRVCADALEPRAMRSPRPERAPPQLVDLRLDNGARVIVQPLDARGAGAGAAAVQLWIGAGTSAERADEHGCAHLLEHMLFKKTAPIGQGRRARTIDLATALENLGGDVNAFTSHDETVVHATVPATSAAAAVAALGAATLGPALDPDELAREREVVVEEIKQYDDEPGQRVFHQISRRVHGTHSYGRPVLGLAREVRGHTAARLRAYHRRAYAGARVTLVVVGAVDVAAVLRAGRKALGGLPRATRLPDEAPSRGSATRPRLHVHRGDVQEVSMMLGWSTAPAGTPEACAFDVAAVVLGHGEASRMVRETRRGAQVVSEVQCASETLRRAGTLLISAHTTGPQVARRGLAALLAQVERMRSRADRRRRAGARPGDPRERPGVPAGDRPGPGPRARLLRHRVRRPRPASGSTTQALAQLTPERVRAACAPTSRPTASAPRSSCRAEGTTAATENKLNRAVRDLADPGQARRRRSSRTATAWSASTSRAGCGSARASTTSVPMAAGWLAWPGGQGREPARAGRRRRGDRGPADPRQRPLHRRRDQPHGRRPGRRPRRVRRAQQPRPALGVPLPRRPAAPRPRARVRADPASSSPVSSPRSAASPCRSSPPRPTTSASWRSARCSASSTATTRSAARCAAPRPACARSPRPASPSCGAPTTRSSRAVLGLVGDLDLPSPILARLGELDLGTGRKSQVAKARRARGRSAADRPARARDPQAARAGPHRRRLPGPPARRPARAGDGRAQRDPRRPERAPVHRPARAPGPRLRGLGQLRRGA